MDRVIPAAGLVHPENSLAIIIEKKFGI